MRSILRSLRACSLALGLATAGCGAATPVAQVERPGGERPSTGSFVPRIARQDPGVESVDDLEARGLRRIVARTGEHVTISDHASGEVVDVHRIPGLIHLALEPGLEQACVVRASAPGRVELARVELATRAEVWARELGLGAGPGADPLRIDTFATPERCVVQWRVAGATQVLVADGATGALLTPSVPPLATAGGARRTVVSTDATRRYEMRRTSAQGGGEAWLVEARDAATLAPVAPGTFWASCVRVGAAGDEIGLHPVEDAARRAFLERSSGARMIECELDPVVVHGFAASDPRRQVLAGEPRRSLPDVWRALPDGRLLRHDASGLYVFDFAQLREPVRIDGAPALGRFVDANADSHPYEPVVPPDGAWMGVIDDRAGAQLLRWDARTLEALPPVALPEALRDATPEEWQVFAGPGEHLVAIGEITAGRRVAFVTRASGQWTRSPARMREGIQQHAEWLESAQRWLVTCPHYGVQAIDAVTGTVVASFMPEPVFSRVTAPTRSPDGTRFAVGVAPSGGAADDAGLYLLDAETLTPAARMRLEPGVLAQLETLRWDERGLLAVTAETAQVAEPGFLRIDPSTGAHRLLGAGTLRWIQRISQAADHDVYRGPYGHAIVTATTTDAADTIVGIIDGDGFVEQSDGRVWCEGRACAHFRCIVAPGTHAEIEHPACTPLLAPGPSPS